MELEELINTRKRVVDLLPNYPPETHPLMEHILLYERMVHRAPADWAHSNYYALAINLGAPRHVPLELPEGYDQMEPRQCFHNAWELVVENPNLYYVEGFALASLLPVEHAWVETKDGTVIDPTWTGLVDGTTHATYLGVRFAADLALRLSLQTGYTSVFFGDNTEKGQNQLLQYGLEMQDGIAINIKEH